MAVCFRLCWGGCYGGCYMDAGVGIMASNLLFSLGASMTLGGVAQMLAPKPRTPHTDNG